MRIVTDAERMQHLDVPEKETRVAWTTYIHAGVNRPRYVLCESSEHHVLVCMCLMCGVHEEFPGRNA